jgi:RNA polymerase sigma-70 factor (ECF subfamily)
MDQDQFLARQFEAHRNRLRAVAFRMLGSLSEAEDAVQESWLHVTRADSSGVENLGGWLTTVVARVCLDMLRSRKSRREEPLGEQEPAPPAAHAPVDPEQEAALADSVGVALMVVLQRLAPAERLSFVLHDMFAVSFDEIAAIVGRSPEAARQLASRARRRVQGGDAPPNPDLGGQRSVVQAFLAALRAGDLEGLVAVLDPDITVGADAAVLRKQAAPQIQGARAWAEQAIRSAKGVRLARPMLVDGSVGLVVAPRGKVFRALKFGFAHGKIARIDVLGDPATLEALDLAVLEELPVT